MAQPTDRELVLSTRNGDREAFRELVERYQRPLFSGAYRITLHAADAADATQTAFVKAFVHLDRFDVERPFFSWIYTILVREALDLVAERRRHTPYQSDSDARRDPRDPERELASGEENTRLRRALGGLSAEHRAVIVLRHHHGLSYREIAGVLELDERTVKSRLYESRQRLREELAKHGLLREEQVSANARRVSR